MLVSLWILILSSAGFISASSKKFVSFNLLTKTDEIEVPESESLIESLRALEKGPELLKDMNEFFKSELTDSNITAYLVSGCHTDQLSALKKLIFIDELVLQSLKNAFKEMSVRQIGRLFDSLPALWSQEALLMLAENFDSFSQLLYLMSYYRPSYFIDALPGLKIAFVNKQTFMNLLWVCIRQGLAPGACHDLKEKLIILHQLVAEFVICTKSVPFTARAELDFLAVEVKMILIRHAIELDSLELLRILVAEGIFYSFLEFENQDIRGNAFIHVYRSARMLLELIALGVKLEDQIKFYAKSGNDNGRRRHTLPRRTRSVFTYLFLQGDSAMNEILMSREYRKETYACIAEESVIYNLPELERFVIERDPTTRLVIDRTKRKKTVSENLRSKPNFEQNSSADEKLEDSGLSYHGF